MSTTNFIDGSTVIQSSWLNDVDAHTYDQELVAHTSDHINYTPAGTGAVATTVQAKLRELVSTTDHPSLQAAVNYAASLPNGGLVYAPAGSIIELVASVTVPAGVTLNLTGATVRASVAITQLFSVTGGYVEIIGGNFENPSGFATYAVSVNKAADNSPVTLRGAYYSQFSEAVHWIDGDRLILKNNAFNTNTISLRVLDNGMNSEITGNYFLGGNGILLQKGANQPEGVDITSNKFMVGIGSYAITITSGLEILISDNIIDQIITGNGIVVDATANDVTLVKVVNNWIGRQSGATGANYGLLLAGNSVGCLSKGNTYVGWRQAGIYVQGLVADVSADFSSIRDYFYGADPCVRDIQLDYSQRTFIDGAKFSGTASIAEGTGVDGRVVNCSFTSALPPISLGLRYGLQSSGMTLTAKGSATIVAAGTAVVITHGLSYTPSIQDVSLVYGSDATTDPSPVRAVNFNSTDFTIAPKVAPGSNVTIGWRVDITR